MSEPRRYRFGPLERRTVVGPLRGAQVLVAGAAAVAALLVAYALKGTIGIGLALLILSGAALVLLLPIEGRTAEDWVPVVWRWLWRSARGETSYRSISPASGIQISERGENGHASLPTELSDLDLLEFPYRQAEVGVIRNRRIGSYATAMAVHGGAFGLREPFEQERKLDAWGAVLASTARESSPVRRLQWIERTLPSDGDDLAGHLQAARDRSVPLASRPVRSYIELIESAAPATQEHEILLVVQVDQRRGSREVKRFGGGDEGACRVLLREAEAIAERLAVADLKVRGLLRPRQYARVIRDGFDPFGRRSRSRATLRDPDRDGVHPGLFGPLAAEEGWSHYRSDTAFHGSYWVSSWPRSDVGAAFLTPLFTQTGIVRTVAATIEPIPIAVAVRRAEFAQTAEEAGEIQRQRQGFSTTARVRRRQEAVSRRESELADGHAEMRFAGYLTVSGRTPEELEQSCAEAEHAAQLARLELQPLYGEQEAGFTFCLPLARGLA